MNALPARFQNQILKAMLPTNHSRVVRHTMHWIGQLEPLPICDTYTIQIDYTTGLRPLVKVLSPKLMLAPSARLIPHMFDQEFLCLFRLRNRHWDPAVAFNRNIIPWISMWLYYYEIWLASGDWLGGGEHPDPPSSTNNKRTKFKNRTTGG